MRTFSEQLRHLRLKRGLTQHTLAEKTGLNPQQIVRYEHGRSQPMLDALTRLAKALGCSLDELASPCVRSRTDIWQQRINQISQLPPAAQKTIGQCVDALVQWHQNAS